MHITLPLFTTIILPVVGLLIKIYLDLRKVHVLVNSRMDASLTEIRELRKAVQDLQADKQALIVVNKALADPPT